MIWGGRATFDDRAVFALSTLADGTMVIYSTEFALPRLVTPATMLAAVTVALSIAFAQVR